MATEMHPPFSETVVRVADEAVESFKVAGWTESTAKRAAAKKDSDK